MRSFSSSAALAVAALLILVNSQLVAAASGPLWSTAQLRSFSDVIVSGRVEEIRTGMDPDVNAIYTYVTVVVEQLHKGTVDGDRVVVKQLGGEANGVGLAVHDQATFREGEHVLLFLERRPRDRSFYTSALWQGKWVIAPSTGGARVAVQDAPAETSRVASQPYRFLGPYRYLHSLIVDVQSGGQPGLAGGGLEQIARAIGRWNSAGSPFQFGIGTATIAARCMRHQLGNGRVTISFMDPCGEISDTGGTLAIGGSYYFEGGGGTLNGQAFHRAAEGFVINNDSRLALSFLTNPGCFEDIQTHELGHVLGLDHSSDSGAMMFATLSNACTSGARPLGQDDINGIVAIYGRSDGSPPATAPQSVQVVVNGTASLAISWTASSGAGGYRLDRLDFRAGHQDGGPVLASVMSVGTAETLAIPPGVSGAFNVVVTALNAAGAGPPSARRDFAIPAPGACSAPPPPVTGVSGGVIGTAASVRWQASAGATAYGLHAGSSPGAVDHVAPTNLGNSLGAQGTVPPGFTTHVRIFALNACGASAGVDFLLR